MLRGKQNLGSRLSFADSRGMPSELFGQRLDHVMIQTGLRLLQADQGSRRRILQQEQVCEEFDGPIGETVQEYGTTSIRAVESEQELAVRRQGGARGPESGHAAGNALQESTKLLRVLLFEISQDVRKVVRRRTHMVVSPSGVRRAGRIQVEATEIPIRHDVQQRVKLRVFEQGSVRGQSRLSKIRHPRCAAAGLAGGATGTIEHGSLS